MSSEEKFDWCEYYNFADSFSSSDNPAELRSGISRFYYSAFCTCRDYIIEHRLWGDDEELEKIMTSKSSKVHEKTYEIFHDNHFLNSFFYQFHKDHFLIDLSRQQVAYF